MDTTWKVMLHGIKIKECETLNEAQKFIAKLDDMDDVERKQVAIVEQRRG